MLLKESKAKRAVAVVVAQDNKRKGEAPGDSKIQHDQIAHLARTLKETTLVLTEDIVEFEIVFARSTYNFLVPGLDPVSL